MKSKITMILLAALIASALSGCGAKYCTVSGCPSQISSFGADYCTLHKCANSGCKNRGSMLNSFSYCMECINRAK